MTLTEEQRDAIRAISKLPMAIGCQLCHPYIMENYGSHFIVLRDMIDGSSMVEPTGGFDLERARGLRDFLQDDCAEVGDIWGEMIAEIERLRARDRQAAAAIVAMAEGTKQHVLKTQAIMKCVFDEAYQLAGYCEELGNIVIAKDAKIADLETKIERLRPYEKVAADLAACGSYVGIGPGEGELPIPERVRRCVNRLKETQHEYEQKIISKDARIKELEDAHKRAGAKYAKIIRELRSSVYANIPGLDVGKIGPDAAKPQSWQITEERKAALWHAIKVLKENDIMEEPEEHLWDEEVTVLQAMLTEAGQ